MILRDYQNEAVNSVYRYLREHDDNPCVVAPTGSGKSILIAKIVTDAVTNWNGRVLVLAHVKELLQQNAEKIRRLCPDIDIGIYSAGLNSRDTEHPAIVAGIQSVYKRAEELGHFDLVIIDEVHRLPPDGEGTYRTLLAGLMEINPQLRVIGLTATPYRMATGPICAPENILNDVCYEIGVRELMVRGYLCNLVSKAGKEKIDTDSLHIRGGEFVASEVETLMNDNRIVASACQEIVEYTADRKSCLVFCSGVDHAKHVAETIRKLCPDERVETVFGDTPKEDRAVILDDFRDGLIKYMVNVNVLTTGFDAPNIDCIAMLRPTMSPGLMVQMIGRGYRLHPGKDDCLVLDYGGNILRHGPVDNIDPSPKGGDDSGGESSSVKECPHCHSLINRQYETCPDCGYIFPPDTQSRSPKHNAKASDAEVIGGQAEVVTVPVRRVYYSVHHKRNAPEDAPRSMRVDYEIDFRCTYSEWICLEHTGYARGKAEKWWAQRSNAPAPSDTEYAVELAHHGALAEPSFITVKKAFGKERFDRITDYELGPVPEHREPGWDAEPESDELVPAYYDFDDDLIPF